MPDGTNAEESPTPAEARRRLESGNERFRRELVHDPVLAGRLVETREGQHPFAAVLGCVDSRAAPEIVFSQSVGDVFSVRTAGHVVDEAVLGSLEFACGIAGAKLVLVLGHTRCGAVTGACKGVEFGHLTWLLAQIEPAIGDAHEPVDPAERVATNPAFVDAVAAIHVRRTVDEIRARSDVLRELEEAGEIAIVGAMYDVAN